MSVRVVVAGRLIPAHAGKTMSTSIFMCSAGAHPRSRGENASRSLMRASAAGSSPLTRGKPRPVVLARALAGLIPAHAGKTISGTGTGFQHPAHPRSRGENVGAGRPDRHAAGSSPLTRGKPFNPVSLIFHARLIPAHAGKTPHVMGLIGAGRAHPRSRGENTADDALTAQPAGSSPLTRGKRCQ